MIVGKIRFMASHQPSHSKENKTFVYISPLSFYTHHFYQYPPRKSRKRGQSSTKLFHARFRFTVSNARPRRRTRGVNGVNLLNKPIYEDRDSIFTRIFHRFSTSLRRWSSSPSMRKEFTLNFAALISNIPSFATNNLKIEWNETTWKPFFLASRG